MKTKRWITIGLISIFPMFISCLLNAIIGISYWAGYAGESFKFYAGLCNNSFVAMIDTLGLLSLAFVITALLSAGRHSEKMDDLDQAIERYHKASDEMDKARKIFTDKTIELQK